MSLSKISDQCKLEEKSFVMAVNSFLESEGTDIRSLCWEGFEYFYMSVYNVYPNLEMDESSYKSYQLNYVTRLKAGVVVRLPRVQRTMMRKVWSQRWRAQVRIGVSI